jgi:hypothetical protein
MPILRAETCVKCCYNLLLSCLAASGSSGGMNSTPNHTPMFDSVVVLPGCSFRWFDWKRCRVGARVQKTRVEAAVNLQQKLRHDGYNPVIKFTGTRREALFAQAQIRDMVSNGQARPAVVYEQASQRSVDHGTNLGPLVESMPASWNCWVVTNQSHWWRLGHVLKGTLGRRGAHIIPHLVKLKHYDAAGMVYGELSRGIKRNVGKGKTLRWREYLAAMVAPAPRPLPPRIHAAGLPSLVAA